ncbi:MAG: M48 family metallopeptidase [Tropicimonas sp.]|uniref:M48 family metallopeptidase n=1 Tax=Tropicimonas sp. TaxID=2067044 RepID=UPI003A88C20E
MPRFLPGLVSSLALVAALSGCEVPTTPAQPVQPVDDGPRVPAQRAARNFVTVVERVEPVAEQVCRERGRVPRCDFQILVDDRPGQPSNAFQTEDEQGRPTIIFTLALIEDARNQDELAFILGHEAAHHIEGHIARSTTNANIGAAVLGGLAAAYGYGDGTVQTAANIGAAVGQRQYSKEYELAADSLGARIAARAGYDPVAGAAYFARIPDPGDRFLGSHPANSRRQEAVRQSVAGGGA